MTNLWCLDNFQSSDSCDYFTFSCVYLTVLHQQDLTDLRMLTV